MAGADAQKSARQQELIAIMEMVKAKKISQAKAEILFREWKMQHEGGQAKSFYEKQVKYHEIWSSLFYRSNCAQVWKNPRFFGKSF